MAIKRRSYNQLLDSVPAHDMAKCRQNLGLYGADRASLCCLHDVLNRSWPIVNASNDHVSVPDTSQTVP